MLLLLLMRVAPFCNPSEGHSPSSQPSQALSPPDVVHARLLTTEELGISLVAGWLRNGNSWEIRLQL
jgi:hypothetical protein